MVPDCPSENDLRSFAVGTMPRTLFESVAEHVEQCMDCNAKLDEFEDDDALIRDLRGLSSRKPELISVPQELMATARQLSQGSDITSSNLTLDPGRLYARQLADGPCLIGRFELQAELGVGSFGYVFRAHDPELDRTVAIKIQRAGSFANEDDIRRFFHEAQSAAQLQHPGVVSLYETGRTQDDVCFLVTEYVDGETLETGILNDRFELRQSAQLVSKLAEALQYAHDHNVIHRDIKPSNVLVDSDSAPHITDFGLAKRLVADQTVTSDGHIMGTPAYMSPEQARGDSHRVDARSDIYSLGVILYELLTGERPFQGNRRLLMLQATTEDPRPPRQLNDDIPKDLETICLKAMARSIQRRYQSARQLAEDLNRFLAGEPIQARPVGYTEAIWRWCNLNPIAASLLLAVTVGSAVGLWHLSNLSRYFVRQTALDSARSEAMMFEGVRDHYSEKIIGRLDKKKVRVALDYAETDDTLPQPAPYLIDVGLYISEGSSGMKVYLHGLHPWRERPPRDEFQLKALSILKERADRGESDLSYHEFPDYGGRRSLRYALGQIMKQSCVDCHNNTETSPKKDWAIGDLVGILEVTRPLDREIERTRQGLRGAFVLMGCTSGLLASFSLGLILATRRRSRRKVLG